MAPDDRLDDLTAREREVLDLVRLGLTNEEIAERLGITEAGVKYHVSQILSKLGVTTREKAAAAYEQAAAQEHVAEAFEPRRSRRWWAALPLAAKAASVAVVLVAVGGLGLLAWGVLRTNDGEAGSGDDNGSGFEDLPGPAPNAEVVAVSPAIASSDSPVFYVRDTTDPNQLIAYDWTGQRRGEIRVSSSEPYGVYPSPDGTMIVLLYAHVVSGGRAVGTVAPGVWAEDNAHLCTFLNTLGGPGAPQTSADGSLGRATDASLFLETTDGQLTRVGDYGSFGPHGGPEVLACNAARDWAVVVQTFVGQQSNFEVLRLSDGEILYQGTSEASSEPPTGFVASQDGSLVAEGATGSLFGTSFDVRTLPGGRVVSHISGGGAVAFSGDNARVLTVEYLNGSSESGRYQVIDLSTSQVVWSAVLSPGTFRTHPNSSDFLVASRSHEPSQSRPNGMDAFEDVWLVPANGSPQLLLQHVAPLN